MEKKEEDVKKTEPITKGIVGIQNVGNTCYMNSAIQLLRAVPEWSAYCTFSSPEYNKETKEGKLLYAYIDLNKVLWENSRPAYVKPAAFIQSVCQVVKDTVYSNFGIPIPNDSGEFLNYMIDNFHEALGTVIKEEPVPVWEKNFYSLLRGKGSPLVQLFYGMLQKTITCQGCMNTIKKWEVFNTLKIPCKGETFTEWISNECLARDEIDGYECEVCKPLRTKALIENHIWHLPKILVILIQRFKPDGTKDMSNCPYDGTDIRMKAFFSQESKHESEDWSYNLYGTINHHGSHMGGHYTCQFKHPFSSEWWLFDDETAHYISKPSINNSTYVLMFRKKD